MEYKKFKEILKNNDLSLKSFSELSGVKYDTCSKWGKNNRPVSDWVESWLKLYERNKQLEELKKDDDCEEYRKALAKALQDVINKEK